MLLTGDTGFNWQIWLWLCYLNFGDPMSALGAWYSFAHPCQTAAHMLKGIIGMTIKMRVLWRGRDDAKHKSVASSQGIYDKAYA